jgi:protein SCO1/2
VIVRRIAAFIAVALAALTLGCSPDAPKFKASDVTGASFGRDFALTDATSKPRTLADFRGKAVVIFFGYTQCPDVCPTNLLNMAEVLRRLGADADRVQVLFVTIDPQRDTRELLAQYVPAFDPRFVGMYTDLPGTEALARDFKVFYRRQGDAAGANYTVDHSTGTYVYDPQGRLRLYIKHGEKPELIAADLRRLLDGK